jgi:hypothetical protein
MKARPAATSPALYGVMWLERVAAACEDVFLPHTTSADWAYACSVTAVAPVASHVQSQQCGVVGAAPSCE